MCLDRFTHPRKSKIYSSSQLEDLFVPPRGSSGLTTRPSYPIKVLVDCTPEDHRLGILSPSPGTRRLSKLLPRRTDEDPTNFRSRKYTFAQEAVDETLTATFRRCKRDFIEETKSCPNGRRIGRDKSFESLLV